MHHIKLIIVVVFLPWPMKAENENMSGLDPPVKLEGRIGGGYRPQDDVVYQLYLVHNGDLVCGASLIEVNGQQAALTAAHCLWTGYPHPNSTIHPVALTLIAGDLDRETHEGSEQTVSVVRIVNHEDFDVTYFHNDISLVFFKPDFRYNLRVGKIDLPDFGRDSPGEVEITGFGNTWLNRQDTQRYLQGIKLKTMSFNECRRWSKEVTDKFICVTHYDKGTMKGFCSGDSGGPAVAVDDSPGKHYVVGIVSFVFPTGNICGRERWPSMLTKVSAYSDWIQQKVSEYLASPH